MTREFQVREIDSGSTVEIEWVAQRMRQTLIEVLGGERGAEMYSRTWLVERVRSHLDPGQLTGQVFIAEDDSGTLAGHTIVRVDEDEEGERIGLFSTTYVDPAMRRFGVASMLLERGEAWMVGQQLGQAVTYTDVDNVKLQNLYLGQGYVMSPMPKRFVKLAKRL